MDRVEEEFVKFSENVSVRGVSKIVKSRRYFFKIVWLCAVVGSTGVLLWQLATLFLNYSTYPHRTSYGEIPLPNVFPSVTICNMKTKLSEIDYNEYLTLEEYESIITDSITDVFNKTSLINEIIWLIYASYFVSLPKFKPNSDELIPLVVDSVLTDITDQPVISKNCTLQILEKLIDQQFYDCYLYQIPKLCNVSMKSLKMILYTNTFYDAQESINFRYIHMNTDGVKILLNAPGVFGDISNGFNISPGTDSLVEMSMKVKTVLNKPYKNEGCESEKYINASSEIYYGTHLCRLKCIQEQILAKCNCVSGSVSIPPMFNNEEICGNTTLTLKLNLDKNRTTKKSKKALEQFLCELTILPHIFKNCLLNCKTPCVEKFYEKNIQTVSGWPKISYQQDFFVRYLYNLTRIGNTYQYFKDYYDIIDNYIINKNVTIKQLNDFFRKNDKIRSNFLQVKFTFTSYYPISVTDSPVYSWELMLSSVGGSLSLWLGITIMTFVEVIEFLFKLIGVIKEFIICSK